jgi:hypothetical protein
MTQTNALGLRKKKSASTTTPVPTTTPAPVTIPTAAWQGAELTPDILSGKEPFPDLSDPDPAIAKLTPEQAKEELVEMDEAFENTLSGAVLPQVGHDRIDWLQTEQELMAYLDALRGGNIQNYNDTALARLAASCFTVRGKTLKPESLRISLIHYREMLHGKK